MEEKIEKLMEHHGKQMGHNDQVQAQITVLDANFNENMGKTQEHLDCYSQVLYQDIPAIKGEICVLEAKVDSMSKMMEYTHR